MITVFAQSLNSNFTGKLWMMRGGTLLILGHGVIGQGQLCPLARGCHALRCLVLTKVLSILLWSLLCMQACRRHLWIIIYDDDVATRLLKKLAARLIIVHIFSLFVLFRTRFLCRLRSIVTHRDHFVRRPSVCLSVRLSHSQSYVSQATHAFLRMLPLYSLIYSTP